MEVEEECWDEDLMVEGIASGTGVTRRESGMEARKSEDSSNWWEPVDS